MQPDKASQRLQLNHRQIPIENGHTKFNFVQEDQSRKDSYIPREELNIQKAFEF